MQFRLWLLLVVCSRGNKKGNQPQGSADITGTRCEKEGATCN